MEDMQWLLIMKMAGIVGKPIWENTNAFGNGRLMQLFREFEDEMKRDKSKKRNKAYPKQIFKLIAENVNKIREENILVNVLNCYSNKVMYCCSVY